MVHSSLYRPVLLALRVALRLLLAALLVLGDLLAAQPAPRRLPSTCSSRWRAAYASLGYAFGLFDEIVPYDELTHAFTIFSVCLACYFLFYAGECLECAHRRFSAYEWSYKTGQKRSPGILFV